MSGTVIGLSLLLPDSMDLTHGSHDMGSLGEVSATGLASHGTTTCLNSVRLSN